MVIENRLPKKQKAQSGPNALGFISIRLEVIGQCRRHQNNHVVETPVRIAVLTGAVDRTAEAARVRNSIIRLQAANLKGIHSDLSQLPDRV